MDIGALFQIGSLILFSALIVAAQVTSQRARDVNGEPVGFGGWLFLFAASQVVTTIWTLAGLVFDLNDLTPGRPAGLGAGDVLDPVAQPWLAIVTGVTLIATVGTTIMVLRRSRQTQAWNIAQSVAVTIETIARARLLPADAAEWAYIPVIIVVAVNGAWIAYLALSRRVRNTLIR